MLEKLFLAPMLLLLLLLLLPLTRGVDARDGCRDCCCCICICCFNNIFRPNRELGGGTDAAIRFNDDDDDNIIDGAVTVDIGVALKNND